MTLKERRELYCWNLTQDAPLCINCKYFRQHYIKKEPPMCEVIKLSPLNCGHCVYPRMKYRDAYATCNHFQNKYQYQEEVK